MDVSELDRIAALAARHAREAEAVAAVLPAEPQPGRVVFLCAYEHADGGRSWLALDPAGDPLRERQSVRDAVSIVALCELAEETAGGGELDDLLSRLVALRISEAPAGIEDAEDAVRELQRTIGAPPQVASAARLDAIGGATRRLEQALGNSGRSPFAEAMKAATAAVEALTADVEASYRLGLSPG